MKRHKGISENFRDLLAQEQVCECVMNFLVPVIFSDLCNFQRTNHIVQAF